MFGMSPAGGRSGQPAIPSSVFVIRRKGWKIDLVGTWIWFLLVVGILVFDASWIASRSPGKATDAVRMQEMSAGNRAAV